MKQVIRIEHSKSCKGLFRARDSKHRLLVDKLSFEPALQRKHVKFPTPFFDKIRRTDHDYCAFKSVNQLNEWIEKEWWSEIIGLGFRVYAITVTKWKEGDFQICYQKRNIVEKTDITSLFL